ncbi:MAG TPA: ribose 5-phosphate isomerase B [Bacteroidales bacterium]|nr:ribose 5-phosphate isomerase B [Bacteroidales bacterium]HOX79310.1 ribose 5-phosphate isomerase B [Bacteroidales bacterium]HPI86908.1 ribose 5-phosphate isomerase B [Bacteroidales bacterium]HPM93109.1 ribose 5-phosphate isomerase B [Bacteroidales bacterium]
MKEKTSIIPIACDHGGYELKEFIKMNLLKDGYEIKDFGTDGPESVDYPDFIHPLAKGVNDGVYPLGIIICGSGNGAQMVANKYPNVRAALCWNEEIARLARLHNNANILSLPGRFVSKEEGWNMVKVFLETSFEGGRHQKRVEKINFKF